MAIEDLTHATFVELLATPFVVGNVPMTLVEVSDLRTSPNAESFSILFRGPKSAPLGQGQHVVGHERLSELELFIVPVGEDQDAYHYEAIFNRRVPT